MTRYICPVCGGEVQYFVNGNSSLWYHVNKDDARKPEYHDVNTYAPYELKTWDDDNE